MFYGHGCSSKTYFFISKCKLTAQPTYTYTPIFKKTFEDKGNTNKFHEVNCQCEIVLKLNRNNNERDTRL